MALFSFLFKKRNQQKTEEVDIRVKSDNIENSEDGKKEILNNNEMSFSSIEIGDQIWMDKNLNVEKFRNGDVIAQVTTTEEWQVASEECMPVWGYHISNSDDGKKLGKLYNYHAVNDPRGLAPEGWHVASFNEWVQLKEYLGGEEIAGYKLKSKNGWTEGGNGSDEYGFSGLPAGTFDVGAGFIDIGNVCGWWCYQDGESGFTYDMHLGYGHSYANISSSPQGNGISVRCIKN